MRAKITKCGFQVISLIAFLFFVFLFTSCKREAFIVTSPDNAAPSTPTGLAVFSAHDGAVGIEWSPNPESDIDVYNIYRSPYSSYTMKKIGSTYDTHFIDAPLSYDTTYYYAISAVDKTGLESSRTAIVSAKPVNRDLPTDIYNISINGRNTGTSKYIHLSWVPQQDYDIKGYEIYRGNYADVPLNQANLVGFSPLPYFDDTTVELMTSYYYKVLSVDKGNLKSTYSPVVSDMVLAPPELIYPADNAVIKNLSSLQFKSPSMASSYKIVIQSNELYGTVAEYVVYSNLVNQTITFNFDSVILTSYKKYFWRVIAYSSGSSEPNSFSPLYSFTYVAE
jgi:hypothetical protein